MYTLFQHVRPTFAGVSVFPIPRSPPRASAPRTGSFTTPPKALGLVNEGTVKLAYETPYGALTSYTGYAHRINKINFDFDGSIPDYTRSTGKFHEDTFQQTVDFNVSGIEHVDLVVGGYYYFDQLKDIGNTSISGGRILNTGHWRLGNKSYAMYFDGTYHFTDELALNVGARYSHDHKTVWNFQSGTPTLARRDAQDNFLAFTPRASLRYEFAPRTNVYASYSQGYRTGGFNPTPTGGVLIPYQPEKIKAYEVGFKTAQSWYRFSTAAFYYDYRNMQVGVTIPNPSGDGLLNLTLNAKRAKVYGIDADLDIEPIDHLHVRAGAAWLHGEYTDFKNATGVSLNPVTDSNFTETQNLTGRQMARAPKFSANLGVDYEFQDVIQGGRLLLASNLSYTDSYPLNNPSVYGSLVAPQWQNEQRFVGSAHFLLNLNATWTDASGHYKLTVFGDNITNTDYRLTFNGNANTGDYSSWGEPRTWGVRAGYNF
jgi:iron complex outermembrane receptor protein